MNALRIIGTLTASAVLSVMAPFVIHNPWLQKHWHRRISQAEYRELFSELVRGEKIACYQCGNLEQRVDQVDARRYTICTCCKTVLWRESI